MAFFRVLSKKYAGKVILVKKKRDDKVKILSKTREAKSGIRFSFSVLYGIQREGKNMCGYLRNNPVETFLNLLLNELTFYDNFPVEFYWQTGHFLSVAGHENHTHFS